MITNSKADFFTQLKYELERVGISFSDDIRIDFEEHFIECSDEGVSESEAAKRLGDVKEIARNYLNLESSRINSIVARDIERRVSLTKPGRDVPADLSLVKNNPDEAYEHIIEYTPEHFSEEIYPQAANSQRPNSFTYNSQNSKDTQNLQNTQNAENAQNSQQSSGNNNVNNSNNVASAFSNAGRAVADAAKVTGSAIADAFGNSNVKNAAVNAGKATAEAVKTAGHSAAEAVKNAVPHPSNSARENTTDGREGTIPNNPNNFNTGGSKGSKFVNTRGLKPNVNVGRLLLEILVFDLLLWSWIVPTLIGIIFGMFFGGFALIGEVGLPMFFRMTYTYYNVAVSLLWGAANTALGLIISLIGVCLVKPVIKLVVHIINRHIRAIYDI